MTTPIGNYNTFAKKYAANVDKKPIHIFYERPNTWSLLPKSIKGLKILDLGCGSGWYAEQLLKGKATVTSVDASSIMTELTEKRTKGKSRVFTANLEKPLDFLEDQEFDIILAPLVIHYIKNWGPFFKELARVLKDKGVFVFSTHQPQIEYKKFNLKTYYKKTVITDYWQDIDTEVQFYHHTLHDLSACLYKSGLVIERLLEPKPLPELKIVEPELYKTIFTRPYFLFIRAKKLI